MTGYLRHEYSGVTEQFTNAVADGITKNLHF